jgi:methyl-accepting chemotaxis protein
MSNADKTTIKIRAHPDNAKGVVAQSNLTAEQEKALELAKRNALLEEENKKSREYVETIEQLRESLKQEQARTAEMAEKAVALESKIKDIVELEAKVKKVAELEAKVKNVAELEAKVKKVAELEAKVKELSEVLGKISGIAATGKSG